MLFAMVCELGANSDCYLQWFGSLGSILTALFGMVLGGGGIDPLEGLSTGKDIQIARNN